MKRLIPIGLPVMVIAVAACGDNRTPGAPSSAFDPYENDNVTVIGGEAGAGAGGERITLSSPVGEGECVTVGENLCVPADATGDWCKGDGGPVDIVVVDGQVVDVICYPPDGNSGKPEEIISTDQMGSIEVLQNANGTAITFDESTNGQPITGDLDVDGNDVSIYGNGPDNTIIDGNVILSGNRVRLRGVTVTGDLDLSKNKVSVVLCRVLGDVILGSTASNNSVFVENDVFGSFTAPSNGNTLTGNDVSDTWSITGSGSLCDANHAFTDGNANERVDDGERGAELGCP